MSEIPTFAIEARYISALYLSTAWAVYAQNLKSKSDAHNAHLAALQACAAFDQEDSLVQAGILKPMLQWARGLLNQPDSTAVWTVTFHDFINLAEVELEMYDGIMARDYAKEKDADWRLELGSKITYLRSFGVVAGEEKVGRWEERKAVLRRAVGLVKVKTKRSLSRLRETLRGRKDDASST